MFLGGGVSCLRTTINGNSMTAPEGSDPPVVSSISAPAAGDYLSSPKALTKRKIDKLSLLEKEEDASDGGKGASVP